MTLKLLAGVALASLVAAPASAATFLFTTTGLTISFELPDSPTPDVVATGTDFAFAATPATVNGMATVLENMTFLSADYDLLDGISGGFSYDGSVISVSNGLQLYTGGEASPTFLAGTYQLSQFQTGQAGTLVISNVAGAVPEPSTWALLTLGFGLTGAAMRRKASAKTSVSFA